MEEPAKLVKIALGWSIRVLIGFLSSVAGLGNLASKVQGIFQKMRQPVDKAVNWLIKKAKDLVRRVGQRLGLVEKDSGSQGGKEGKYTPQEAVIEITRRLSKEASQINGKNNESAGHLMKSIYDREAKWVSQNVEKKNGSNHELLLIPRSDQDSWWIDVKINPKGSTPKWPKSQVKGAGGVGDIQGKKHIGMFHGSNSKLGDQEIDINQLKGRSGNGSGLELGSGFYLSHYFSDVKGYAKRKKTHGNDGWIHKYWLPEWIMKGVPVSEPNTGGDSHWENIGDVVKGKWLHIGRGSWKAGYQWAIKSSDKLAMLKLEDALNPYPAADRWGRGRRVEFPGDFGGAFNEPVSEGRKLAEGGSRHNPYEPSQPQDKGLGD